MSKLGYSMHLFLLGVVLFVVITTSTPCLANQPQVVNKPLPIRRPPYDNHEEARVLQDDEPYMNSFFGDDQIQKPPHNEPYMLVRDDTAAGHYELPEVMRPNKPSQSRRLLGGGDNHNIEVTPANKCKDEAAARLLLLNDEKPKPAVMPIHHYPKPPHKRLILEGEDDIVEDDVVSHKPPRRPSVMKPRKPYKGDKLPNN